jgi:carboxylesterase type B
MSQEVDNGLAEGLDQAAVKAWLGVEAANPAQGEEAL